MDAATHASLFRVLGDPTRLRIIKLLALEEFCVCELVDLLGLSQPAVSQHLAKLRAASLVSERRWGQWVVYRLDPDALEQALGQFVEFLRAPLHLTPGMAVEAERRSTLDRVAACRPFAGAPDVPPAAPITPQEE